MNCDFCNTYQEELLIFVLPCGYSVCYDHIKNEDVLFKCFKCLDHLIDKQKCLEIRKNQTKLDTLRHLHRKEIALEKCNRVDDLRINLNCTLNNHFLDIINRIDLKREILKNQLNQSVDQYCLLLIDNLKKVELNSISSLQKQLDGIDTKKIRNQVDNLKVPVTKSNLFSDKTESKKFCEFDFSEIDKVLDNFDKIKQIKFEESKKQSSINVSELFGTVSSNISSQDSKLTSIQPNENKLINKLKSCSKKFILLGEFGLKKFEELNTGELISSSHSNPSNLLVVNPNNEKKSVIIRKDLSKITFILKTIKDEIINLDTSFNTTLYHNGNISRSFMYPKCPIMFMDIFKSSIFTIDNDFNVTERQCSNGKIEKSFQIKNRQVCSMKVLTNNKLLTGHDNRISVWNMSTGVELNSFKMSARVLIIERLNDKEFLSGCNDGQISIWYTQPISKKCHDGAISCIQVCDNGDILSLGSKDGIVRVWEPKNLSQKFEIKLTCPIYCKILKNKKLAYINSEGKVYLSEQNLIEQGLIKN